MIRNIRLTNTKNNLQGQITNLDESKCKSYSSETFLNMKNNSQTQVTNLR